MASDDEYEMNEDGELTDTVQHPNANKPWTNKDRRKLLRLFVEGKSWEEIRKLLGRGSANAVMLEWAKMCEKGELVEIGTSKDLPSITPKPEPENPEKNFGKEPGETYDVVRRSNNAIWYSFKLTN